MNRIVIITGATGGIGRALTLRFAKEGDRLVLAGHSRPELLEEIRKEAVRKGAAAVRTFVCDLATQEGCDALASFTCDAFGTPDLLINNAGISRVELFQDSPDEGYTHLLHANLSSAVRLTKRVVPGMIRKQCGRIINISSVHGLYGASCEVEYSVTKGGLIAFTKALAKELAPSGISVNCIAPGAIDTEMNANLSPEERAALEEEIPCGRFGTPEEVADLTALIAAAPDYLTGAVIQMDGAWE